MIDITQDQFYPGRRDHKRVVITDRWDTDYGIGDIEELEKGIRNRESESTPILKP